MKLSKVRGSDASSVQTMGQRTGTTPHQWKLTRSRRAKAKGRQGQGERQSKEQGQAEGRNVRHVEYEVFLLQGERLRPKGLLQILSLAR